MKYKSLLYVPILTSLTLLSTVAIAKIYVYKDSMGIQHYSDKPPLNKDFKTHQARPIDTIKWKKTETKLKIEKQDKPKPSPKKSDKKQKCWQLKAEISKTNDMLQTKLKAKEFDLLKYKLNKIRWEYQKHCS